MKRTKRLLQGGISTARDKLLTGYNARFSSILMHYLFVFAYTPDFQNI